MSYTGFEWDEAKNQRNIRKHGEMLIRIISARKAPSREIELYEKKF